MGLIRETASFRLEFFDPLTGQNVALNSTATWNDLDRNSPGDQKSVTIDSNSFASYATANSTSLSVVTTADSVVAAGTLSTTPSDQNAWFSAEFANREFIEFTLETRSSNSGFSLSGDLIDDPNITPFEEGNDTIEGGEGNDEIFGQGGNDNLSGDDGDDIIEGGTGNDTISGGKGDDQIDAGDGQDTVLGGNGNDTIFGGGDNDSLTGQGGRDTIIIDQLGASGNNDTVVDGSSAGDDFDTLYISPLLDSGWSITNFTRNPESNGNPGFDGVIEFERGGDTARIEYSDIEDFIFCFTPGAFVVTESGTQRVDQLRPGDKVQTRDNGIREIFWCGQRELNYMELLSAPKFQPILIKQGALGGDHPSCDVMVSPNHRMLVTSSLAELLFGENEVLIAAKFLTGLPGVRQVHAKTASYVHLMFEQHEVVSAGGVWSESFQPGDYSLRGLAQETRQEVLELFPELQTHAGLNAYQAARLSLKSHEAKLLLDAGLV